MTPARVRRRAGLAIVLASLACGGEGNARVTVPAGASMREAADSLEAAGVIGSAKTFRFYAKLTRRDRSIKPGLYLLDRAASWNEVIDALVAGKGIVLTVTTTSPTPRRSASRPACSSARWLPQPPSSATTTSRRSVQTVRLSRMCGLTS